MIFKFKLFTLNLLNLLLMKNILPLFFFILCAGIMYAQNAIVPVGGTATGSNGSATYTVGQIAVQHADNGSISILEGVQQPYEIQTVGVDDYPGITLEAIVYPNPTQNRLNLRISNYEIPAEGLTAQLFDASGRLLQKVTVSELETQFELGSYATATYQLRVLDGNRLLKTFKVVKTR